MPAVERRADLCGCGGDCRHRKVHRGGTLKWRVNTITPKTFNTNNRQMLTSSAVDAGHVQFIDDIQLVALSRRAGLAILVATLALSSASFTSASLIIVVKQLRSSLHDG